MRIEGLRLTDEPEGRRASARVTWEGSYRGPTSMWFETDAAAGADLEAAPEAFALAAMPCAIALGEPRLVVEGVLDARLRDGLEASMTLFSRWYPWCRRVPVEASGGFAARTPRRDPRGVGFLSGGVDSLSMFRDNRLAFPLDHPLSLREAIHLEGWNSFDWDGGRLREDRRPAAREQRARLERLGAAAAFAVTAVRSNVRTFHPGYAFTKDLGFGAGMIAAAHCFPRRFTDAWFASHGHGPGAVPHASHFTLDGFHSSGAIEVRMAEPFRLRMEKLAAVAAWDEAFEALQVCLRFGVPPAGQANCGECEKCRRTMLALVALGGWDRARTFPRVPIDAAFASLYRPSGTQQHGYSNQIADALLAAGREDLALPMRGAIRRAERREAWRHFRGTMRRLFRRGAN